MSLIPHLECALGADQADLLVQENWGSFNITCRHPPFLDQQLRLHQRVEIFTDPRRNFPLELSQQPFFKGLLRKRS
jgi:hypothetical protein